MLCRFARTFPPRLAARLGLSKGLRRRFREETATEMLLMGLLALPNQGLRVDFSADEKSDGADMDWETDWYFVSPNDPNGGSYVRLLIQAKVAMKQDGVASPYWYYAHLDYDGGTQAQNLMNGAAAAPEATLPLYMFFHPSAALAPANGKNKAVEGINLVPAADVHAVVTKGVTYKSGKTAKGCRREDKKVDRWRPLFFNLHDLFCWMPAGILMPPPPPADIISFALSGLDDGTISLGMPTWHPDFVAQRLNELMSFEQEAHPAYSAPGTDRRRLLETRPIPPNLRRAIDNEESEEELARLPRTRIILTSPINRRNPRFDEYASWNRRRRDTPDGD